MSDELIKVGLLTFQIKLKVMDSPLKMESPLKMMKNAFYFTLKALVVLKIFKFLSCLCMKNGLIRKIRSISKFMMSQPG